MIRMMTIDTLAEYEELTTASNCDVCSKEPYVSQRGRSNSASGVTKVGEGQTESSQNRLQHLEQPRLAWSSVASQQQVVAAAGRHRFQQQVAVALGLPYS